MRLWCMKLVVGVDSRLCRKRKGSFERIRMCCSICCMCVRCVGLRNVADVCYVAVAVDVEDMLTLKYEWLVFGDDDEQACSGEDYTLSSLRRAFSTSNRRDRAVLPYLSKMGFREISQRLGYWLCCLKNQHRAHHVNSCRKRPSSAEVGPRKRERCTVAHRHLATNSSLNKTESQKSAGWKTGRASQVGEPVSCARQHQSLLLSLQEPLTIHRDPSRW